MKNIFLIILISILTSNSFAQKKKKTDTKTVEKINVVAKADNLTAEIIKNNFYLFANNGKSKDTLSKKTFQNLPTETKILGFKSKGNKLYFLTWNEKTIIQTATKTEDKTFTNSEIFDVSSRTKVFTNIQIATKIKEQVFLDRLKNASETQERLRNEGFVVTLLPDGDLSLKTKTQENKMTYDAAQKKYIDLKKKK